MRSRRTISVTHKQALFSKSTVHLELELPRFGKRSSRYGINLSVGKVHTPLSGIIECVIDKVSIKLRCASIHSEQENTLRRPISELYRIYMTSLTFHFVQA